MPNTETVTDAYADWKHWKPDQFLRFTGAKSTYFQWHTNRAAHVHQNTLKILEMGFGNGEYLGWALHNGHQVAGVELSTHLLKLAKQAGILAVHDVDELQATEKFDLVVAFDVLEHIAPDQLPQFLLKLSNLLVPRGTMLFRFPNAESPLGSFYQNGDITHVNALGVSKILQLCKLTNLKLLHEGDSLPLGAIPWRALPRAIVAHLVRTTLQWVLGPLLLGHSVRIAANEVVVLGRIEG